MSKLGRRSFLKASVFAGTAAWLSPHSRVLGANDEVRVGVIGTRNKGGDHCRQLLGTKGARLVAICDVDEAMLDKTVEKIGKEQADIKLEKYRDLRKMLENKDLDAVVVATPNHWHILATVWACQAGKDVYVEKPCSYSVWEGRKGVEAARKYNRIVQTGTQRRSCPGQREAFDWINKGNIGKIQHVRALHYQPWPSIGKVGPQTPPATVDYDLWCGPGPKEPMMRKNLHYDWHWFWNYGNGELANNGVHYLDLCRWVMGLKAHPTRVLSFGGRFAVDDDGQTPNCQTCWYDFKPFSSVPLICEIRGLPDHPIDGKADEKVWKMGAFKGLRGGFIVQCENGYYAGGGGGGWTYDNKDEKIKKFSGDDGKDHMQNFINVCKTRKLEELNADILEGHLSAAICHLGNISHRVGKVVKADDVADATKSDPLVQECFARFRDNLSKVGLDLTKPLPVLGPTLNFDPEKEQFSGEFATEANKLLTREYRAPFVVPEKV
ncbi:MAG TPA: Gfo/Idh/MocA family oxidoreductase [Planctomycetota bacterium]|jgi:predicted dehydrogenase